MTITTTDLDRVARQRERIRAGVGFIAALDQSGGSTPRALAAYGIGDAAEIQQAGLVPIIEPEVAIEVPDKADAERLLADQLQGHLDDLGERSVMLELTLPEQPDLYERFAAHPRVERVVALSGGYDRHESCRRLREAGGMTASFSRVLMTGLTADLDAQTFESRLADTVTQIHETSTT